jgi:hypothetical protein
MAITVHGARRRWIGTATSSCRPWSRGRWCWLVWLGLGRIVALYHHSSNFYQIS